MRVTYLAQEHNAVPRPGLEPGPPDPESSALTIEKSFMGFPYLRVFIINVQNPSFFYVMFSFFILEIQLKQGFCCRKPKVWFSLCT